MKAKLVKESLNTEDYITIYVNDYPYFLIKYGDTTHLEMVNDKKYIGSGMASHIGQHFGEPYYDDLRTWLKGGPSPDGKHYISKH